MKFATYLLLVGAANACINDKVTAASAEQAKTANALAT